MEVVRQVKSTGKDVLGRETKTRKGTEAANRLTYSRKLRRLALVGWKKLEETVIQIHLIGSFMERGWAMEEGSKLQIQ